MSQMWIDALEISLLVINFVCPSLMAKVLLKNSSSAVGTSCLF